MIARCSRVCGMTPSSARRPAGTGRCRSRRRPSCGRTARGPARPPPTGAVRTAARAVRSRARSRCRAPSPAAAGRCRRRSAPRPAPSCRGRCARRCRASEGDHASAFGRPSASGSRAGRGPPGRVPRPAGRARAARRQSVAAVQRAGEARAARAAAARRRRRGRRSSTTCRPAARERLRPRAHGLRRLGDHPQHRHLRAAPPAGRDTARASPPARPATACRCAARGPADGGGRARPRRRVPTMMPACGPPSSLSPEKQTSVAPASTLRPGGRLVGQVGQVDQRARAEVVDHRRRRARAPMAASSASERRAGEPDHRGSSTGGRAGSRRCRAPTARS